MSLCILVKVSPKKQAFLLPHYKRGAACVRRLGWEAPQPTAVRVGCRCRLPKKEIPQSQRRRSRVSPTNDFRGVWGIPACPPQGAPGHKILRDRKVRDGAHD